MSQAGSQQFDDGRNAKHLILNILMKPAAIRRPREYEKCH